MQMPTRSSRPFVALVTDLTDKYRFNPYVRTTVNVILLQIILTILTIAVFGWGIQYSQTNTLGSISTHIKDAAAGTPMQTTLPESIANVRSETLTYVFLLLIVLTTLFSYLAARFALRPTRNSLQFQKRFIGNVAHEIRTPLAIIKTSTEVALMDPHLSADVRSTLEETITELDRISETINNLLSFDTLIRPGRVRSEPFDLRNVVETVLQRHAALAASRGIALTTQMTPGRHVIIANPIALDQVLTNLVKNAINYTPQHKEGSVTVGVENDYEGRVTITVSDTGIGIAQKDLFHIFEPFYRAETSRVRGVGSGTSGLGLAIVSEIVRLHRGTIVVRSALGRGTTFELSFPRVSDSRTISERFSELEREGMNEATFDMRS